MYLANIVLRLFIREVLEFPVRPLRFFLERVDAMVPVVLLFLMEPPQSILVLLLRFLLLIPLRLGSLHSPVVLFSLSRVPIRLVVCTPKAKRVQNLGIAEHVHDVTVCQKFPFQNTDSGLRKKILHCCQNCAPTLCQEESLSVHWSNREKNNTQAGPPTVGWDP